MRSEPSDGALLDGAGVGPSAGAVVAGLAAAPRGTAGVDGGAEGVDGADGAAPGALPSVRIDSGTAAMDLTGRTPAASGVTVISSADASMVRDTSV